MWTFFAKALRHSSSSARATVTTTASNFISSVSSHPPQIHLRKQLFNDLILSFFQAFLGHVIFGETHATLWWVGMILTLTGLYVLHGSTSQSPRENVDKKYDWQKKTGSNRSLSNAWSERLRRSTKSLTRIIYAQLYDRIIYAKCIFFSILGLIL